MINGYVVKCVTANADLRERIVAARPPSSLYDKVDDPYIVIDAKKALKLLAAREPLDEGTVLRCIMRLDVMIAALDQLDGYEEYADTLKRINKDAEALRGLCVG